jgi:hypothetical protein
MLHCLQVRPHFLEWALVGEASGVNLRDMAHTKAEDEPARKRFD